MTRLHVALPLIPDGDQARGWAEDELARDIYRVTEPTPFDRFARAVGEFLADLFTGELPGEFAPWLAVVVVLLIVAIVVAAILIWGRPRAVARSRRTAVPFGRAEHLSATELRRGAETAAGAGDWDGAIVLRFRAVARGLAERTLLDPVPGTTVHGFSRAAGALFPAERSALDRAADAFDDVRYLRRPGTEAAYRDLAALDARLDRARVEAVPA